MNGWQLLSVHHADPVEIGDTLYMGVNNAFELWQIVGVTPPAKSPYRDTQYGIIKLQNPETKDVKSVFPSQVRLRFVQLG